MNQKEAVFQAIRELKRGEVEAAEKSGTPVHLSKQEKKVVEQKLFEGFRAGKIQYNNEPPSDDKLTMYVSGLVSNWLRKDKRLNGNRNYVPQRPGSRTGAVPQTPITLQQSQLAAMNPEEFKAIQALAAANGGAGVQIIVVRPAPQQQQSQNSTELNDEHASS